jgi:serine/threonine-protein kinase
MSGSLRLAGFIFCLTLGTWAVGASHIANLGEAYSLTLALSWASLAAFFIWIVYVALEPFVRRRMPTLVISWNRLLAGQFRDPMVGRDLLVGVAAALFFASFSDLNIPYAAMRGFPPPMPSTNFAAISGGRVIFAMLLSAVNGAILDALAFLFLVVILQWVLRNRWLAVAGFVAIFTARAYLQGGPAFDIALNVVVLAAIGFLMFRYGLVAVVAFQFAADIISGAPITTQSSAWYAWMGWLVVAIFAVMLYYGARIGLAGQPLFGKSFADTD